MVNSFVPILPSETITIPTAQALSLLLFAVSKSMAANVDKKRTL